MVDWERVAKIRWHVLVSKQGRVSAVHNYYDGIRNGKVKFKSILMHRFILNAKSGMEVDHRDLNALNNVRSNLRICSHSGNMANRLLRRDSFGKYKGVQSRGSKWRARIRVNGIMKSLGTFSDIKAAARAYDTAANKIHGEFARTNF